MAKLIDLTGQRFWNLVAIRFIEINVKKSTIWEFECDCGNRKNLNANLVKRGTIKHCGCKEHANFKNLTGVRFGRLLVERYVSKKSDGHYLWQCKCDCGNIVEVGSSTLTCGLTQSCGCITKELLNGRNPGNLFGLKYEDRYEGKMRSFYRAYESNALSKKRVFDLSFEEFQKIVESPCFYCGSLDKKKVFQNRKTFFLDINGIDRVDNLKGYEHGNVVPCCTICNQAKKAYSQSDFLQWIKRVYDHMELGKETK